jgi:hypothetical protein
MSPELVTNRKVLSPELVTNEREVLRSKSKREEKNKKFSLTLVKTYFYYGVGQMWFTFSRKNKKRKFYFFPKLFVAFDIHPMVSVRGFLEPSLQIYIESDQK